MSVVRAWYEDYCWVAESGMCVVCATVSVVVVCTVHAQWLSVVHAWYVIDW